MGILSRLYNPYHLAKRYADAPLGTSVGGKEVMSDMAWKAVGGLTLAPVIYLLTSGKGAGGNSDKDIKEYISTRYVSIPSAEEPDVTKEILESHKQAQDPKPSDVLDVLFPTTRGMGYAVPFSAASLIAALFAGNAALEKSKSKKDVDRQKAKQDEINKRIGELVEHRYRESRGLDKDAGTSLSDAADWLKETMWGTKERAYNVITSLTAIGILTGLTAGWAKGRSMNERVILDKGIRKALEDNQVVHEAPKVIVPNTYSQYRESSSRRAPVQKRTPVQDII